MKSAELLEKLKEMISELKESCEDCQEFDCSECNIKVEDCPMVSSFRRWQNE